MILAYLIKSTLCLAVLVGFYKLALENKAMHQFKRYYLLTSLVFAFTIPLITITYIVDTLPEPEPVVNAYEYYSNPIIAEEPITVTPEFSILPIILWSIYGLGVLIFGMRFVLNLVRLSRKINNSDQHPEKNFTLSLINHSIVPHSFLKWIFLNKSEYLNQEIEPEVLAHEATHVRQKHSWDILFIESLQVVFWFNPLIWLSKKSIKLNHEFLADQGVITNKSNIAIYQNILLSYASNAHHTALESPFNYSLTKKRILMLSQTFSHMRIALAALLLIPILVGCVYFFNKEIAPIVKPQDHALAEIHITDNQILIGATNDRITINARTSSLLTFKEDLNTLTKSLTNEELKKIHVDFKLQQNLITTLEILEKELKKTKLASVRQDIELPKQNGFLKNTIETPEVKKGDTLVFSYGHTDQKGYSVAYDNSGSGTIIDKKPPFAGVSKKELETYNHLAKKYNKVSKSQRIIPYGDLQVLERIFKKMNEVQRYKNEPFPECNVTQDHNRIDTQYSKQYLEGAQRNGEKAITITIQANQVYINGKKSSLATFRSDVDAATKEWEETDYTEAFPSVRIKNPDNALLKELNQEFLKTHLSKANGGMDLLPPPPPPVPSKTLAPSSLEPEQKSKLKKVDTITITVTDTGEQTTLIIDEERLDHNLQTNIKRDLEKADKLKLKYVTQNLATKKEIAIYNRLAKKYNPYNGGEIKLGEVARMYDIYSRMTAKQKKRAESYPVLPPPPPPPPTEVKNDKNDGDKNNPPPPPPPKKATPPSKGGSSSDS